MEVRTIAQGSGTAEQKPSWGLSVEIFTLTIVICDFPRNITECTAPKLVLNLELLG